MVKKTFYIKFTGYCETILHYYCVEAEDLNEAVNLAIQKYLSDLDVSEGTEEEYNRYYDEFLDNLEE